MSKKVSYNYKLEALESIWHRVGPPDNHDKYSRILLHDKKIYENNNTIHENLNMQTVYVKHLVDTCK